MLAHSENKKDAIAFSTALILLNSFWLDGTITKKGDYQVFRQPRLFWQFCEKKWAGK